MFETTLIAIAFLVVGLLAGFVIGSTAAVAEYDRREKEKAAADLEAAIEEAEKADEIVEPPDPTRTEVLVHVNEEFLSAWFDQNFDVEKRVN